MLHKWLTIGLKQSRLPEFYTLSKIIRKHQSADQSSLVIVVQQSVSLVCKLTTITYHHKTRVLYKRHYTDFLNFIENTQIPDNVVPATLDVSPLSTNIPQDEGIDVVCRYYEDHYEQKLPILTSDLRELMRLILKQNSFKLNEKTLRTKLTASLWELKWQSLFPLFSWRTLKNDC